MPEQSDQPTPVQRAEEWVDEKTDRTGGRPKGLEDVEGTPDVDDLRRQQHREMRHVGLGTEGQFRGAVFGTVVGGGIGAVLGLLVGLVAFSDAEIGIRVVLPMVLGFAAGAGGQFVYWGSRTPELENETTTATGEPQAGSAPRDPGADDRGR